MGVRLTRMRLMERYIESEDRDLLQGVRQRFSFLFSSFLFHIGRKKNRGRTNIQSWTPIAAYRLNPLGLL